MAAALPFTLAIGTYLGFLSSSTATKIHDSRQVQVALASWEGKVQLHFLPPYCPDHNRIERIWKDLHDNVTRNHCCKTMEELMGDVYSYLRCRRRRGKHSYPRKKSA